MKLFAHIVDPTGLADGLQGWCQGFVTLAESDDELQTLQDGGVTTVARTEAELEAMVGPDLWPYYVEAPNAQCAGWRYENGQFVDPEA